MFFFLSKTLNILLNPLIWILILLILAILYRHRRLQFIKLTILALIIFSNPILSNLVIRLIETPETFLEKKYKVAVVLSGMTDHYDLSPVQVNFSSSADRFTETLRLYHSGKVDKIVITGGSGSIYDEIESESPKLGHLAATLGVRPKDLILETKSNNTYENAAFTAPILREIAGGEPILLITSSFHMKRAKACFEKQGMEVTPYPVDFRSGRLMADHNVLVPSANAMTNWNIALKELVGLTFYKVMGYI